MQPVGKFDNHDLRFRRSSGENFSMHQFFKGLLVSPVMGDLGTALHNCFNIGTKLFPKQLSCNILHILHGIMEQRCRQNLRIVDIKLFHQDSGNITGVHNVGVTRPSPLVFMGLKGKIKSMPEYLRFRTGTNKTFYFPTILLSVKFSILHSFYPRNRHTCALYFFPVGVEYEKYIIILYQPEKRSLSSPASSHCSRNLIDGQRKSVPQRTTHQSCTQKGPTWHEKKLLDVNGEPAVKLHNIEEDGQDHHHN